MAIDTGSTTTGALRRRSKLTRAHVLNRAGTAGPFSWALLVFVVGLIIGLIVNGNAYFDWSYALVNALFAFGTAMAISWGGLPAFGQGLYYAIGGYTSALLVGVELPTVVLLLVGGVVAALVAWVFVAVASNLSFVSFAMLSLVFGEAGNQLIYTVKKLGGENGLYGVARPSLLGTTFNTDKAFYFYCLAVLVIITGLARWLYQSTTGRSIRAVRDDAVRAEALGIRTRRTQIVAFTAGGFVCGVAGVMYSQLQGVVDPNMGTFLQSTIGVMMVIIGGLGTFFGAVIGGVVYRWLDLLVTDNTQAPDLWIGLVFILVVLLTPVMLRGLGRYRRGSAATRTPRSSEEAQ